MIWEVYKLSVINYGCIVYLLARGCYFHWDKLHDIGYALDMNCNKNQLKGIEESLYWWYGIGDLLLVLQVIVVISGWKYYDLAK